MKKDLVRYYGKRKKIIEALITVGGPKSLEILNKLIKTIIPKLDITRWAFDVDLLYQIKKHNFSTKEHPTRWHDSSGSKLKVHRAIIEMFLSLVRLRLINSKFRFIIRFYDSLPESVKIHRRLR